MDWPAGRASMSRWTRRSSCSIWRRCRASRQLSASSQDALLGRLKEDFEEEAAVAFVEQGANLRGLHGLVRESRDDQSGENLLRLEALIEPFLLEALGNLAAKALGFHQHADQAALDGFGGFADKFRLGFHFAAALVGSFAESRAQHGFVNAELLRDPRGPLRT